jgi:hypothetical protein
MLVPFAPLTTGMYGPVYRVRDFMALLQLLMLVPFAPLITGIYGSVYRVRDFMLYPLPL